MIRVLRAYHEAMGKLAFDFQATVGRFAGDGLMLFFNDPVPCADPALRAVRMAIAMRETTARLSADWRRHGYTLGFGVGIAYGHATLAQLGFEGRFEYEPNGPIVNLAARLSEEAHSDQILISARVQAAIDHIVEVKPVGELTLKGFARPVPAFNVLKIR